MNKKTTRESECIGRVLSFGTRTDVVFAAKETALFTNLTAIKTQLNSAAARQNGGNRGFRESSNERNVAAKTVRVALRDIAEIAKSLAERGVDVGANEAFRMPPNGSYERLAAATQSFIDMAEPRQALFVERGLAATFVEDLEAQKAILSGKGDTAGTERGRQVGGTAGMQILAKQGMDIVRELRAIMRVKLRSTPGLLEEWHSIARVHTNVRNDEVPEQPAGSGSSGSGTGSTPVATA